MVTFKKRKYLRFYLTKAELLALTPTDVDLEKGTVSISKTYYRRDKQDFITSPKTESSNRKITIPEFLQKELKEFLDRQYGLEPEDRIFPITDRAVQKKMKQKIEELGLKNIRVHDLRHSHIACQGIGIKRTKERRTVE